MTRLRTCARLRAASCVCRCSRSIAGILLGDPSSARISARNQLLLGRHKDVEIEREIFVRGIGDDANRRARNFVRPANRADDLRFHFNRVRAGGSHKRRFPGR